MEEKQKCQRQTDVDTEGEREEACRRREERGGCTSVTVIIQRTEGDVRSLK